MFQEVSLRFLALGMVLLSGILACPTALISWANYLFNPTERHDLQGWKSLALFTVAMALVPAGYLALFLPTMSSRGYTLIGAAHLYSALLIGGSTLLSVLAVIAARRSQARIRRLVMIGAALLGCIDALHLAILIAYISADSWTH